MQISYVVSAMVFWQRNNRLSLERECELLKSLGYGLELWPNTGGLDECLYEEKNWGRLAGATEGMLVSMRSRNDNPTIEQWAEQLECAKLLKANIVADVRSLGLKEGPETNGWDFTTQVVEMAKEKNIKLCVETGALDTLQKIGDKFDSIWYCLDTGCVKLAPDFDLKKYVDALGPRIGHLHLTDNYGQCDDHMPVGCCGGISKEDWGYLIGALEKYDNDVIGSFEMSPCTPEIMINHASKYLFDILGWPGKPKPK